MLIHYKYTHLHLFFNNTYFIEIHIFDILKNIGTIFIDLIYKYLDFVILFKGMGHGEWRHELFF